MRGRRCKRDARPSDAEVRHLRSKLQCALQLRRRCSACSADAGSWSFRCSARATRARSDVRARRAGAVRGKAGGGSSPAAGTPLALSPNARREPGSRACGVPEGCIDARGPPRDGRAVHLGKEMGMGLRVNTNVAAVNAQRNLINTTERLNRSLERLSSGLRITRASDDAAGLAISERFRADIRSLAQAERNAMDGVSMLQVAEGALHEVSSILIRMRELAIQASNGTLGDSEREALDKEFQALIEEIDRIASVTEFNGTKMLLSQVEVTFQIGIDNTSNDRISVSGADVTSSGLSLGSLEIKSASNAQASLSAIDDAIKTVSTTRASFGAAQNRLESAIRSIRVAIENTSAAESRIRDVDVAAETAELTRNQVLQQAGISVLAQANLSTQAALALLQ
ncbi:MAG TPA: flagellin [Myxococcota bacterium]